MEIVGSMYDAVTDEEAFRAVRDGLTVVVGQRPSRARLRLNSPADVAAVLAVSLPTAFTLDANGIAHAALWGVLLGGVVMVVGGPLLMRFLRRIMLAGHSGGVR